MGSEMCIRDRVVFSSGTGAEGTLVGGESNTTATHYVKKDTDITLDTPTVIANENQTDLQTGEKFKWVFTGWRLEIKPNTSQGGASSQGAQDGAQPGGAQTQPSNPQPAAAASTRTPRHHRSLDGVLPFTTLVQTDTPGNASVTPAEGSTPTTISVVVSAEELKPKNLGKTLRKLEAKYGKTFTQATYRFIAQYEKQPYVIDASKQNTMHEGDVGVMFLPAPNHTWKDGSSRPYVYYVNADAGDITPKVKDLTAKLGSFVGWTVYDNKGELVTDPTKIAEALKNPKHAYTFIAKQAEIPNLVPRDDVVITEGDLMPSYNEMVKDTPQINPDTGTLLLDPRSQNPALINGVEAFSTLRLNPRFAGWETDRDSYAKLPTDKPGIYRVRFGLKYYTDEQELDPRTKQPIYENDKPKYKVETKWVDVSVHILPRVMKEQDLPADGTREARFVKANYTKVSYRVALGDHGFLASPNTTFYVRRGYTIDPNALLNFNKQTRDKHLHDMQQHAVDNDQHQMQQEIGVPSTVAEPGYVFYEWQKHAANEKGDVIYLAHFHKLPITHFAFETSTTAEQPFSTRLVGDAQNHPTYKPTADTKLYGVSVSCNGETCTVSGTPHISDWKDGEEERVIELHFEAVDKKDADKYDRSSFGLQKEITIRLIVKRPHATSGGAGGGMYIGTSESIPWTELTPGTEVPAEPAPAQPELAAAPQPRRHTHARLPQTSDATFAEGAAELLGMGLGMISAVAMARKKRRKDDDASDDDVNGGASGRA